MNFERLNCLRPFHLIWPQRPWHWNTGKSLRHAKDNVLGKSPRWVADIDSFCRPLIGVLYTPPTPSPPPPTLNPCSENDTHTNCCADKYLRRIAELNSTQKEIASKHSLNHEKLSAHLHYHQRCHKICHPGNIFEIFYDINPHIYSFHSFCLSHDILCHPRPAENQKAEMDRMK